MPAPQFVRAGERGGELIRLARGEQRLRERLEALRLRVPASARALRAR